LEGKEKKKSIKKRGGVKSGSVGVWKAKTCLLVFAEHASGARLRSKKKRGEMFLFREGGGGKKEVYLDS